MYLSLLPAFNQHRIALRFRSDVRCRHNFVRTGSFIRYVVAIEERTCGAFADREVDVLRQCSSTRWTVLRSYQDQSVKGRASVLYGSRGTGGWVATFKTMTADIDIYRTAVTGVATSVPGHVRYCRNYFCCSPNTGHPNVAVGLLLMTQSGRLAQIDSLPTDA